MKRSPLRKRGKSKATIDKADRALQDWFRAMYPNKKCEVAGCRNTFSLMHHHLEKSISNAGRYNHDNLIFICKFHHDKIHLSGDRAQIIAKYTITKGKDWVKRMDKLRKESKGHYGKKELETLIKNYQGR